jgi:hypothetical protein
MTRQKTEHPLPWGVRRAQRHRARRTPTTS